MEATINDKENVVPYGIRKLLFLSTGTAWDNFDINLETLSGKDTIHHTYIVSTYSSLGTIIVGSGRSYILSEADTIAMGFMGKFLKGKMFIATNFITHYYPQLCKDYI